MNSLKVRVIADCLGANRRWSCDMNGNFCFNLLSSSPNICITSSELEFLFRKYEYFLYMIRKIDYIAFNLLYKKYKKALIFNTVLKFLVKKF